MAPKSRPQLLPGALGSGRRLTLLLLSLAAAGVAGYLAWVSFSGSDVVGCGPDSGCAAVLNSRWAYWLGLPVSLLGVGNYLAIFAGGLALTPSTPAPRQSSIWKFLLLTAWLALGAALWFILLQLLVIRQFCPFCLTAHGLAVATSILILISCPYGQEPSQAKQRDRQIYVPPSFMKKLLFPVVIGLAFLAAGQFVAPKKTFVEQSMPGVVQITTNATPKVAAETPQISSPPSSQTNATHPSATVAAADTGEESEYRSIALFDGKLQFDLVDVPIIGQANAPHVIIGLHDYTCQGCRSMHEPLMQLYRKYSNQLAIVSLPLPLDADCNPIVPKTPPAHANACQYAKISLAVWRAKPEALTEFDDWIFGPDRPPSVDETVKFARGLVGDQAYVEAWNDPLVDRQLKINIALYGLNYQVNKRSSMPQLFVGNSVLFGSMSAEELEKKVVQEFGLQPLP